MTKKRSTFVKGQRRVIPGLVHGQLMDLVTVTEGIALIPRVGEVHESNSVTLTWNQIWNAGRRVKKAIQ